MTPVTTCANIVLESDNGEVFIEKLQHLLKKREELLNNSSPCLTIESYYIFTSDTS